MKIKRNDVVVAISGSQKGASRTGKVLKVDREKNTALVEGFKLIKRYLKRSQDNPQLYSFLNNHWVADLEAY